MFKCKHSCFVGLFGFYPTHERFTNSANETLWVNKPYFSKAHNLKWQILLLLELGAWGWMGNQPGFWLFFFSDCCLLVCNPQSHKIHKPEPLVMAFKMDFVSISVSRKGTNIFAVSPLCHIWNIYLALPAPTNLVLTLIPASAHTQLPLPQMMFVLYLGSRHPWDYRTGLT